MGLPSSSIPEPWEGEVGGGGVIGGRMLMLRIIRSPSVGDLMCIYKYQCLVFGEYTGPGIRVRVEAEVGEV